MQALILAGGEGTRLRPLTSTISKPVVPLVDRPFIVYMLEWLRRHGVDDVILACGFLATSVHNVLGDGSALGMRLRFVEEPEPLGTAGALKFAQELLDERFLMLNGDVLSDMDLGAQLAQHERTGARATLALVSVPDPSAYGLVRLEQDRSVAEFVEKPSAGEGPGLISAGAYVLERDVLELIPEGRNVSIEREVWPRLVGDGLYGCPHEAYWLDIGTPQAYLKATVDILEGLVATEQVQRIGDGCEVADGAHVGSTAVLGAGVKVGRGTRIEQAVVMQGAEIGEGCEIEDAIVGAGARVGDGTVVTDGAVLGEGVTIGRENLLSRGIRVFPGTELGDGAIRF